MFPTQHPHRNKNATTPTQNGPQFCPFFDHAAPTYSKSASNVTSDVIRHMLNTYCSDSTAHPINPNSVILDNACGPGTVTSAIFDYLPAASHPHDVHCTDISPAMIEAFQAKAKTFTAHPHVNISANIVDAQSLTSVIPENHITHAFMTFAIYSVPDASKAVQEMHRVMRSGGICLITTWIEMGFMTWYSQAQAAVRPDLPPFQGLAPMWWRKAENVRATLIKGGFSEEKVQVVPYEFEVPSRHFPDRSIMGGMINMITKGWDASDKERFNVELERILAEKEKQDKEVYGGKATVQMVALIGIGEK